MRPSSPDTGSVVAEVVLPRAVTEALARLRGVRPDDATAAEAALTAALAPLAGSVWPEVAWRSSRLTGTGLPVELAWTSRDAAVRWTCEAAGPETPASERLARCEATASRVDTEAWAAEQRGRRLRWGAWLGGRHLDGSPRTKVYAELPAGTVVRAPWAVTSATIQRHVTGLAWRMAGCNDDGTVELYARVPMLTTASLAATAGLVGAGDRLLDLVGRLLGRGSARDELPRPSGVSVVMALDGAPLAVTWFAFAKAMWSSDAVAARALTGLCADGSVSVAAHSTEVYDALVSGRDDGRWRHGMVGAGVDHRGTTWLQAGVRPT